MNLTREFQDRWKILGAVSVTIGLAATLIAASTPAELVSISVPNIVLPGPTATPVPTPVPFTKYEVPKIPNKSAYAVFVVGDSMTFALGPHPYRLSVLLNERYHEKGFIIDNYSLGATSILGLEKLLTVKTQIGEKEEPPAIERDFDILVIESFGHNPLSQFPIDEGLRKQEESLDAMMTKLIAAHPHSVILFLATIAPSEEFYARNVLDLPPELRANYAKERRRYIENFIDYAGRREVPLINVYAQSLNPDGTAKREFISSDDNIHPSQKGVEFIQDQIAQYIFEHNFLPY